MAGRRSCVNSLWSGTERVRIGERLKATLAGVLELELLRCKHLDMVDGALEVGRAAGTGTVHRGAEEGATGNLDGCAATPRRQQVSVLGPDHRTAGLLRLLNMYDGGDITPTSRALRGLY